MKSEIDRRGWIFSRRARRVKAPSVELCGPGDSDFEQLVKEQKLTEEQLYAAARAWGRYARLTLIFGAPVLVACLWRALIGSARQAVLCTFLVANLVAYYLMCVMYARAIRSRRLPKLAKLIGGTLRK